MPLSVAAGRDSYRSTACQRNSSEEFVLAVRTDSRLQTGQNPILVNANCTSGAQVGQTVNDLQGLSLVLAVDDGQNPPTATDCPSAGPRPWTALPTPPAPAKSVAARTAERLIPATDLLRHRRPSVHRPTRRHQAGGLSRRVSSQEVPGPNIKLSRYRPTVIDNLNPT